jgi:hypothetical protein
LGGFFYKSGFNAKLVKPISRAEAAEVLALFHRSMYHAAAGIKGVNFFN